VDQAPRHEHRDVEAAPVPRHDLRHELVDPLEKALDRGGFGDIGLADGEDPQALLVAKHAGNHHDPLQVRGEEIAAAALHPALLEGDLGDVAVGQVLRQVVELADPRAVGNRLDIKSKNRSHG
jgi:hypothetical protein